MKNTDIERLRLVTPPLSAHEEPLVFVPSINYDAELDTFYIGADDSGNVTTANKPLPTNFHTTELLEVDPSDTDSLLAFQRQWGFLTSMEREPLREDTLGTMAETMATPRKDGDIHKAVEDAERLYDLLAERHPDFKRQAGWLGISTAEGRNGAYVFVPREEAEGTLRWLQETVSKLVDAHSVGFDNWSGIEGRLLRNTVGHIDAAISPYYPRYRMADSGIDGSGAVAPVLPLTIATLAQLFSYIATDEGYRVCKQCGRYFLFKRHTSGSFVRNRRSMYCSDTCKERASWTGQAARRKAQRNADKGSEEGR